MPILSKTSYLIFIVSNFLGTVHGPIEVRWVKDPEIDQTADGWIE